TDSEAGPTQAAPPFEGLAFGRAAVAVGMSSAIATASLITVAVATPVTDAFGATALFGLLLVLQRAGSGVGTLAGGGLVDRMGVRWAFQVGAMLTSIGALAAVFAPWFWVVLGTRIISGLGSG